jgi:hypothetical protein
MEVLRLKGLLDMRGAYGTSISAGMVPKEGKITWSVVMLSGAYTISSILWSWQKKSFAS